MKIVLIALSLPLLIGAGPCTAAPATGGSAATALLNADSVAAALRAAGIQIKTAGPITQPFFSAPGRVLIVEGNDLQVYDYPSSGAAAADAAKISPSGSPIGTSMPNWMRPPHFYHKDKLILVYLGSNRRVRSALEAQAGPQIAGAP